MNTVLSECRVLSRAPVIKVELSEHISLNAKSYREMNVWKKRSTTPKRTTDKGCIVRLAESVDDEVFLPRGGWNPSLRKPEAMYGNRELLVNEIQGITTISQMRFEQPDVFECIFNAAASLENAMALAIRDGGEHPLMMARGVRHVEILVHWLPEELEVYPRFSNEVDQ